MAVQNVPELIRKEGWQVIRENGKEFILADGEKFPYTHPCIVHLRLFRTEKNPQRKYIHMKAAHDYLWPGTIWHYWTERRFRKHCEGFNVITYAGGASCAKSYDAAKIAILFWLANPTKRSVVIASTSLESLSSRIWGYVTKLMKNMAIDIPYYYLGGQTPKILPPLTRSGKGSQDRIKDTIHGMFAIAAKQGDDEKVISSWIGRHPDEALMLVLDEGTDMPPALVTAIPNLESGVEFFQVMAIGNSLSKFDLHGALSTPKNGWESVNPEKDTEWETTQKNGICLFFSCYESPAVHETNPERKEKLSKFLATKEKIDEAARKYGKDSDLFYRFILGFWRSDSTDSVVVSKQFVDQFDIRGAVEYSGAYPIRVVAGLDVAFSTGGDKAILRLAILGQAYNGQIVLDYRKDSLLFPIPIVANTEYPADLQVSDFVLKTLQDYNCDVRDLAVDCTGQGRAIASLIQTRGQTLYRPLPIYSTQIGNKSVRSFDVIVRSAYDMWYAFRDFIQNRQIKGLDNIAALQLTNRRYKIAGKKPVLESKAEYKTRMRGIAPALAHSPDEADAAALCLQAAMINYGFSPGQKVEIQRGASSFESEKLRVYKQMIQKEQAAQEKVTNAPPVADFQGRLEDLPGKFGSDITDLF